MLASGGGRLSDSFGERARSIARLNDSAVTSSVDGGENRNPLRIANE